MSKGKAYKQLNPVIAINIMNFDLFDQTEQFHTTYHLYEDTEKILLTDVMGLSKKPCIAGILDSSDDVSQNVDLSKQKTPLLKMG